MKTTSQPEKKTETPEVESQLPEISETNPKIYRCQSQRLKIKRFQFEKSELRLKSLKDVEEFEALLEGLNPTDRIKISTIDLDAANALALQHMRSRAHSGGMHSGVKPVSQDTINMHNAEDMARAGMSDAQIEAARISTDSKGPVALNVIPANPLAALVKK